MDKDKNEAFEKISEDDRWYLFYFMVCRPAQLERTIARLARKYKIDPEKLNDEIRLALQAESARPVIAKSLPAAPPGLAPNFSTAKQRAGIVVLTRRLWRKLTVKCRTLLMTNKRTS